MCGIMAAVPLTCCVLFTYRVHASIHKKFQMSRRKLLWSFLDIGSSLMTGGGNRRIKLKSNTFNI